EGLADLVAAETEAQRRQAYQQLRGLLGDRAETWRQRLIEALALVEAGIDFSDEDDVPKDMMARALELIRPLAEGISKAGAGAGRASARRPARCHRGSAECGQVDAVQPASTPRGCDRVAVSWHHARCPRIASRSRRLSGDGARYRRHSRNERSNRTRRRAASERAGRQRKPRAVGHRCYCDRVAGTAAPSDPSSIRNPCLAGG